MTSISTLTPSQYNYLYGKEGILENQPTMTDTAISIMSGNDAAQQTQQPAQESGDNKDDGKIGFFQKIGSFFKGIGKTVVNAVKGLNPLNPKNWGNILKTAACVAISIACPPAGVAIACVAGVKGAINVGKGIHAASNAKTDAEAEAAWENIGSGTFQVGMAAVGAKAGMNAIKAQGGLSASLSKTASSVKNLAAGAKTRLAGAKQTIKDLPEGPGLSTTAKAYGTKAYESVKSTGSRAYDALKTKASGLKGNYHMAKDQFTTLKAGGQSTTQALRTMGKQTRAYQTYDMSRGFGNSRFHAAGDVIKNTKAYTNLDAAATRAGYASGFKATTPAIANLLDQANSDDEMTRQQAIYQLEQLGYYNVYQ